MKIVSLLNHKGGVGKTTTVVNLGAALAKKGKKVLLIDLDPQANLTNSLDIPNEAANIHIALNMLRNGESAAMPVLSKKKNLDVVPSHLDLTAAEIMLLNETGREFFLRDLIGDIKNNYDYILIDCPPSLGVLTTNALAASDGIIIPLQTELLALQGMKSLFSMVNKIRQRINSSLSVYGILLTQFDGRTLLNNDVHDKVRNAYGDSVFSTVIRKNIKIAEAPSKKSDVIDYDPKSAGANDYMELAKEMLKKYKN